MNGKISENDPQYLRHSDEIMDIITAVPPALLRWGTTLFIGVFVMILGIAAFIHYPDEIKTILTINSTDSSGRVMSCAPGKIGQILVVQDQTVRFGQPLAYIETKDSGKYVLTAPIEGKLTYAGIIHQNATFERNQEIFKIAPVSQDFFGEMIVPPSLTEKIHVGQQVLIKLTSYPAERFGILKGRIKYIAETIDKNGNYMAEVKLDSGTTRNSLMHLTSGMSADAEIIIQDATVLQRVLRNITRSGVR